MESLSDILKNTNTEPVVLNENELEIETKEQEETPQENNSQINIVSLNEWFDQNISNFSNIKKPTVSIQGVDQNNQLIITVAQPEERNLEKRKLIVFDDINLIPVLNIPAFDMQIFNNGFRILYDLNNGLFIKSYSVRNTLISVFCNDVDDKLIPYHIIKCKKRDDFITITEAPTVEFTIEKLKEQLDIESLILQYRQSSKVEGLTTKQNAIYWLIEKQGLIYDINHHLQIDNVIINLLYN